MSARTQKILSVAIGMVGLAMLVMMVTVESEPGALPLGLILFAVVGYTTGWMRARRR